LKGDEDFHGSVPTAENLINAIYTVKNLPYEGARSQKFYSILLNFDK
jgi:hypothetical protein